MSMKKLSIVIAIYNKKEYIRSCIESALAQALPDMEIICVDDGSTDGTREILQEYAAKYSQIKLILHEYNQGTCSVRYDGLANCTGEYMTFMDADDEYAKDTLGKLVELAKRSRIDVLEFGTQVVLVGENVENQIRNPEKDFCPEQEILYEKNLCKLCYVDHRISNFLWNKLFSRKIYRKALESMENWQLANLSDVLYFLWHLLFFAQSYQSVTERVYRYYAGRGMTMRKNNSLERLTDYCRSKETCYELERLTIRLGKGVQYAEVLKELRMMCIAQSVGHWIEDLEEEKRQQGLELLLKYWGTEAVRSALAARYWEDTEKVRNRISGLSWCISDKEAGGVVCLLHGKLCPAQTRQIWLAVLKEHGKNRKPTLIVEEQQFPYWENRVKEDKISVRSLPDIDQSYRRRSWQLCMFLEEAAAAVVYLADLKEPICYWDSLTAVSIGCKVISIPLC